MRYAWRLCFAALACLGLGSPAWAEERIRDFDSVIAVQKDGALDVTETIRVDAENDQIKHGIYRDFPTRYTVPNGGKMRVGFAFQDATLDGGRVGSAVENRGNGVRIKLGSAESLVTPGEHAYKIHYRVTRELGLFKTFDELYWNVTGNAWAFPIDRVAATITLPSRATFGQRSVYTGAQGSTATEAEVIGESPGSIRFATTAPLAPYEGLTVAVAFPKGVVAEPTGRQKMVSFIADLLPMLVAGASLLGLLGFLYYAWKNAGRDPRRGPVVPLFSPPDDISPGAMRYVTKQGLDNRAFAAAIVDAGVKGHVRLVEEKGFLFMGGDKYIEGIATPSSVPLQPAEQSAIAKLVSPGGRIELDNANHAKFSAAKNALEQAYKVQFEGVAFNRNYGWAGLALAVWAFGAYLTALAVVFAEGAMPGVIQIGPLVAIGLAAWLHFLARSRRSGLINGALNLAAFALMALAGMLAISTIGLALVSGRWQPVVLALVGLPVALSAWLWISAPTPQGRALLDRIAAFKHYLSITERERLDRMQAPSDTLHTFERFLPYAIALGVENHWADRFASQLAAAAAASAAGQQGFAWYAGSQNPWSDTGGFVNSLGSSLSSSISSASTAPGSSSGSGGGGSSGGGGGGGGGGGW
ncbi:MAG: DUF2207 domain-containing protein [Sphingomicrobium sp.]